VPVFPDKNVVHDRVVKKRHVMKNDYQSHFDWVKLFGHVVKKPWLRKE
jgi:hypothetical protein